MTSPPSPRRFPAPWSVRELEQAFVVSDANGQALAYTYFRKDENEARQAHVLTHDEARRVAANIAKTVRPCADRRRRRAAELSGIQGAGGSESQTGTTPS